MKRQAYFRNGVIVGVLTMGAVHSLREDIMGQDKTIELTRVAWMPWYWSVPLALAMVVAVVLIIVGSAMKAAKDEAADGR